MVGVVSLAAIAAITPVVWGAAAGNTRDVGNLQRLEARYVGHLGDHAPSKAVVRADKRRAARCARSAYRARHKALCPAPLRRGSAGAGVLRASDLPENTGQWAAPFQTPVIGVNSAVLPTGKVLMWAYPDATNSEASNWATAWLWDPATGQSTKVDPPIDPDTGKPANIWCAGQALLADGRLLVAGGNRQYYQGEGPGQGFKGLDRLYTFNPFNETWTEQPRMNDGHWYPSIAVLPDGRAVIMGGLDKNGSKHISPDVEVFTPSPDMNGVGTLELKPTAARQAGLYPHLFVTPAGKLLLAGQDHANSALLDPATWIWQNLPPLPTRREWGTAVLMPSGPAGPQYVLLNGGSDTPGAPAATNTSLVMDLNNPTAGWKPGAQTAMARSHGNNVILPDGTLTFIGGGIGQDADGLYGGPVFTSELYSPATNSWKIAEAQAEPRTYHSTAVLLPDGRVLSAGDDRVPQSTTDQAELYSPPYLFKGARPRITTAPAAVPYGVDFGVATPDGVASAVLVKLSTSTHAVNTDQRSIRLAMRAAGPGVSLTSPANANLAPPGYYMLFLLNAQGVPSVGKMIKLDPAVPPPPPVVDQANPTVILTAPATGTSVTGTVTLGAVASDDVGVAAVRFWLDGVPIGTDVTAAPYVFDWDTRTTSNGIHTLRAIVRDRAGNAAASNVVNIAVANTLPRRDMESPEVTVTQPGAGSTLAGTRVLIARASDDIGVVGVRFKIDGQLVGAEDTASPYSINWNSARVANGRHQVSAVARDAAGKVTESKPVGVWVNNRASTGGGDVLKPGPISGDTQPPRTLVRVAGQKSVRTTGRLRVTVRCDEHCTIRTELRLTRAQARRLGLPARSAVVIAGSGTGTTANGTSRHVILKLSARAKARLAATRGRPRLEVRTTTTDDAGNKRIVVVYLTVS
jgi:hypothetical protein